MNYWLVAPGLIWFIKSPLNRSDQNNKTIPTNCRAAQWILVNDIPFSCVSIFSGSQAAIKSLSNFVNNSRFLGNIAVVLTFFLGASPVYHWCGFPGTSQFWETAGRANSPRLLQSFRNPLRLNWMCHMPRSSCPLRENSFGTPTFPGSMRSPAPPLDSPAPVG